MYASYLEREASQADIESSNLSMWKDEALISQNYSSSSAPSIIQHSNNQVKLDIPDCPELFARGLVTSNFDINSNKHSVTGVSIPYHQSLMLNYYIYNELDNQFQYLELSSLQWSENIRRRFNSDTEDEGQYFHSPDNDLGSETPYTDQQVQSVGNPCPTCKCRCRSEPQNTANQEQDNVNLEDENSIPKGDNDRFSIFRRTCKSDVLEDSGDGTKLNHVELRFANDISFKTINQIPWTTEEETEGRRIVRVTRLQRRNVLSLELLIVTELSQLLNQTDGGSHVEVSCIKYNCSNRDKVYYLITSVEVIKIIELLTGSAWRDPLMRRVERGRLRSNLGTFWLKEFLAIKSNNTNRACLKLLEQLSSYEIRTPYNVWKDLRLMPWDNLLVALSKVLCFYHVKIPYKKQK